ncbi:putative bifunctional diguanylate cyclase/phosphodiesterase [Methylobrevis pamukkalensis]|uniref:Cyclic di-GMP phosphodiesterase Gmr n=1 Tax=Methylobrevis pamukkalensis TaxID=1439726 RepID=A0A1E3H8A9_9HYPH|nr:EAL domain-containing protein [Methylobrevis pamukkalensis]ODN71731.1 Cyclic di-GMP phosphodiesterase Gmr [Methylobrevis pamukkalensis]
MTRLLRLFTVDTRNPHLMRAQMAAFTKQVPLLYFILVVNAAALAGTFVGTAPLLLSTLLPVLLGIVCLVRFVDWLRMRNGQLSDPAIRRRLKSTVVIGGVIGLLFLGWALALFPYGDERAQDHVVFFVGITVISCVFCLMHLRPAALLITTVIQLPFLVFLVSTGDRALFFIAVNLALVTVAMVYILVVGSRDFARMIESRIETERLSDENARLANIDSLTSLPNRRQFFAELDRVLARPAALRRPFAVGVIDLDGFKPVNDRFGHLVGDQILTEAGRRLIDISAEGGATGTCFIARLGGDEFGLILDGAASEDAILAFGDRICTVLEAPFSTGSVVARISGSVGFATGPETGTGAMTLYERADYALYHAKGSRRGHAVLFSDAHENEIRRKGIIEQSLRDADLERELDLHFQPMVDVVRGRTIGFEALARWTSPALGPISPAVFIPLAERSDAIGRITRVLLSRALAAARGWPDDIRISFNLSARELVSPDEILRIIALIEASGIAPHRIDIEVTETSVIADFDKACESLRALRALGLRIALDDFGTGYSSLSHVHRLPLDKIKVDRSFIQDIETRNSGRSLVKSVVDLCQNLEIDCVIEGIETEDQLRILKQLGCTAMQGYYFSRPMPLAEVPAFLARCSKARELRSASAVS